jgi:hypothetical protein
LKSLGVAKHRDKFYPSVFTDENSANKNGADPDAVGYLLFPIQNMRNGYTEVEKYENSVFLDVKTKRKPSYLNISDRGGQIAKFLAYLSVDSDAAKSTRPESTGPIPQMIFVTTSNVSIGKTIIERANRPLRGKDGKPGRPVAIFQAFVCDADSSLNPGGLGDMRIGRSILLNEADLPLKPFTDETGSYFPATPTGPGAGLPGRLFLLPPRTKGTVPNVSDKTVLGEQKLLFDPFSSPECPTDRDPSYYTLDGVVHCS